MKKLLAVFAIGLMIVMTMPQADAAKRFGGGSSFGRQAPVPALSQKAPAANPAQNFNRQQANPAAGAAAAAKPASPWKGMLMGAAAALGIAALASALGLVLNLITEGAVSVSLGMTIGTLVVLFYTVYGGMWSVAFTDFFQMLIIVLGLAAIAFCAGDMAGGFTKVIDFAESRDLFNPWPEMSVSGWLFWISAAITMMIGSIPQQDVFQRVMSAKSAGTAARGAAMGGAFYIVFAFVPMFIVCAAVLAMPGVGEMLLKTDPQRLLPTLVKDYMPGWLRVLFFGAVLSAVMSTASATMLAPSTTFVQNVLKGFVRISPDKELTCMRATLTVFAVAVLTYSLWFEGTAIYDMVAMAYQFPVVGAFWPLVCGLYWKRATAQGAWLSILVGGAVWITLSATPLGEVFPSVLGGFIAAAAGMVGGSLLPTRSNARYRRWQAITVPVA